jgi:chromosomal replication initiation ATPase DnaA
MTASVPFAEPRQLALPLDEPVGFSPDDFVPAPSNAQARIALAHQSMWINHRLLLWGDSGCGKSHLASVWAQTSGAQMLHAASLRSPIAVDDTETPLVIEDIDTAIDPIALLASLNIAYAAQRSVLMTARIPPARLQIDPADLASRLRASLTIEITQADDRLLGDLLDRLAANRQLRLSAPLRHYLLTRLPRQPGLLREAVTRLDRASLACGVAPSRRFAEHVLIDLLEQQVPAAIPQGAIPANSPNFHDTIPLLTL